MTKKPYQTSSYIRSALTNYGQMCEMNANSPYIHNHIENFELGYESVKTTIINGINARFSQIQTNISNIADQAEILAQQQCQQLGFDNSEELNTAYRKFLSGKVRCAFADYLKAINEYKHMRAEALSEGLGQNEVTALQEELKKKFQSKRIKVRLNQTGHSDSLDDYDKLIQYLGTNPALAEMKLGNIAEPIVTEYFKKIFNSNLIKKIETVGKGEERNINTQDVAVTDKDGNIIRFSLKFASTTSENYSDVFSVKRGSAGSKVTEYNLDNMMINKYYAPDLINCIQYVVYNNQMLTGTKTLTEEVMRYIRNIVGWEFILNGLFGNAFTINNIENFPMFLVTQDRIITMGEILKKLSTYTISQIEQLTASDSKYKFEQTLGKGRNSANLLKAKQIDLQTQEAGQRLSYAELKAGANTSKVMQSLYPSIKKNLSFRVHYRIALENIQQLL